MVFIAVVLTLTIAPVPVAVDQAVLGVISRQAAAVKTARLVELLAVAVAVLKRFAKA